MIISVVNQTNGEIADPDLLAAIRVVNQQIANDFAPYWHMPATLRLEGTRLDQPRANAAGVVRGDAVLYVTSETGMGDPEGFHERNFRGVPYGVVYSQISEETGDPWSVTLSHEVIELIADPQGNNYIMGRSPHDARKTVFYWFELCDAVSSQTYEIDGIALQSFLLPAYFEPPTPGARTNFLGLELAPFGIAPESYLGYYDPERHSQETTHIDARGKLRHDVRQRFGGTRSHRRRKS